MGALALILVGACVGFFSGMFGIGGGVILVPALVILFHFSQQQAQGTSLAVLSVPICAAAAAIYYRNGYIELRTVIWVIMGFVGGAVFGATLVPKLPMMFLRRAFGLLLWFTGAGMMFAGTNQRVCAALLGVAVAIFANRRKAKASVSDIEYHI